MGKKYVLVDDLTGEELPGDTAPVYLTLGRNSYHLYLSEESHGKLLEALDPFIEDAEYDYIGSSATSKPKAAAAASTADKERMTAIRTWAQSTGFKYENAKGEKVTLGDRGRIPQVVIDAYEKENG